MAFNKVRVGAKYTYRAVMLDKLSPPYGAERGILKDGDVVKVVNLHGCPPANTMGHCYVNTLAGEFAGLVCTNSLVRE